MKNNIIKFSDLGRKELRCLIFEDENGRLKVKYDSLNKLKNKLENTIEVYNPNIKQREEIIKLLTSNIENTGDVNIDGDIIIKTFLPMLTNIELDLNEEQIKEIVADPSDTLLLVQDEIGKIIGNIVDRFKNNIDMLQNMTEEEREILFNQYKEKKENPDEQLTEEELEIIEKAKRLGKVQ